MGGEVRLDARVTGLEWRKDTALWTVTYVDGAGAAHTITASRIVSSAPLRELVQSISPSPKCLPRAMDLDYRDFLTVVLIGRSRTELDDNWIYIHDPSVKLGRVQNFRSWSPDMIPDGVSTCLGLEYFCFEGDDLWSMSDADLIALARREIAAVGLMAIDDITDGHVVRQRKAYPVYDDRYGANVAAVRDELAAAYPSLHLIGRNGMHKYNNQDHAMMTGMLTAANIVAGRRLHDVWRVNEDAEYLEAGPSGAREALASERLVPRRAV
jgi:protoporphyrinogen oxidase